MGEHKIDRHRITEEFAARLTKDATDKGLLMEIGWIAMLRFIVPREASETQVAETRKAFFMGADHLFASIMNVMDSDREVTEEDLRRMDMIEAELKAFRKQVTSHHVAPARTQ